jgi:glycosyltransferase involved in cell wall biosynthesis
VAANESKNVLFTGQDELYDQSKRAERVLEYVLGDEDTKAEAQAGIDVALARRSEPVLAVVDERTTSRVLFVTSDESVLVERGSSTRSYVGFEASFDEVHVMVLVPRKGAKGTMRVGDRTWIYPVFARHWWRLPWQGRRAARELLVFNGNVRPDIVVGTDPFEAGLAAYLIGKTFRRPVQLHLFEDWFDSSFLARDEDNKWRQRIARYLLKRVTSVRTATGDLKKVIAARFPKLTDLEVLPRFYNFSDFLTAETTLDIHDRYRDLTYIMLTVAPLTATSALQTVFAALNRFLKNPRMGLVVIGTGPAKQLYIEKSTLLGIAEHVVFVEKPDDLVAYLRTADALIEASTDAESEETIMRAAAAGLPIVAAETEVRRDLFQDGASAFLCPPGDTLSMFQKSMKLVNSPALRKQFSRQVREVARDRLIEDPAAYYRAYRDSVEVALGKQPDETRAHTAAPVAADGRTVSDDGMSYPSMPVTAEAHS